VRARRLDDDERRDQLSEHPNVTRTREYLDTFAQGDLEALRPFFSDDVVWHVAGNHPLSGDYFGKDELIDYFHAARELSGGTLSLEPSSIMANDAHVVVMLRVSGEREGKKLDIEMAEAFTVLPDGTWSEFWAMPDDQASVDEFWA
jgi:ketosteroid isomerase-like protein